MATKTARLKKQAPPPKAAPPGKKEPKPRQQGTPAAGGVELPTAAEMQGKTDVNATPAERMKPELRQDIFFANPKHQTIESQLRHWSKLINSKSFSRLDTMRLDDQCSAALACKKQFILGAGWDIESPKGFAPDWEVTVFVKDTLKAVKGSFDRALMELLTALDFGFAVQEKVYAKKKATDKRAPGADHAASGDRVVLQELRSLAPYDIKFITDEYGRLKGVTQSGNRDKRANIGVATEVSEEIARNKLVTYSYRAEFGNLYGKSDLEAAHRGWFIKDQSYMFLGRALERFGVPPVFAHYDARALGPDTQLALETAMKNWRNGMTGLFPRGEKAESLEFWTPELANQTGEAFDRAIRMFDGAIARAILMPGLLGMTNDSETGSLARSGTHLDVFLMIIEFLRKEIADTVVNDQIVRQLVDLNFMVDEYPVFKFLPLEGDTSSDLIKLWGELTGSRVVRTTPADERHIRNAIKFPAYDTAQTSVAELPVSEDPDAPPGSTKSPYGPPDPIELEAARAKNAPKPGDEPGGAGKPGTGKPPGKFSLQPSALADRRALTAYERKVDFARIEATQNGMAAAYAERLRKAISVTLDMLMNEIRSTFNGELSFANYPRLPGVDKWQEVVGALFNEAFDTGRESIRGEVPKAFAEAVIPAADYGKALEYLRTKAFWVTGVTHDRILNEVREALLQSISTGEPIDDIMWRIRKIFEPYVAATASAPGVLLEPSRLETIVRTNLNDVYNMGRIQQAREAGDFLDGFQYSAILDSRTTEVCRRLDGRVFMADDPRVDRLRPPRHHNCRSVYVPIIVGEVINPDDVITDEQARQADELSGDKF